MSLFYHEISPSADVSRFVISFWEFRTADEDFGVVEHEVFPDGCVSLFYRRNLKFNLTYLAFNGLTLETLVTPVLPNDTYWGMRISPAACAGILQTDPKRFHRVKMLEAEKIPYLTAGLREKLDTCLDFQAAIEVFENHLRNLNFPVNAVDEKISQAVKMIEESGGEVKIAELALRLNLSARQLERRFKTVAGLSPKQFVRTRRIRAAAVHLVENASANWAERAAETGFADQAHLTHEFVSFTKRSPNSFAKKVKEIEHGELVK